MKKFGLFLTSIVILLSCSDEMVNQRNERPFFTLSQIKSSNPNGRTSSVNESTIKFNLGDIKASREFYFLIGNGGDNPIYNIKLETTDQKFIISPQKINVLEGKNSSSGGIIPLVSLGVIHGVQLNGVGYTDLLPMGENTTELIITGKIVENGDSIEISNSFDISVYAKQMDLTLYSDDIEIDFSNSIGNWIGYETESGLPGILGYEFNPSNFKIKNTGNVNINISFTRLASGADTIRMILQPNQLETILLPKPIDGSNNYSALLSLESNGTITDRSRIRLGTNGKGYLIIQHFE